MNPFKTLHVCYRRIEDVHVNIIVFNDEMLF